MKVSRCCHPIPGDPIVGFITTGAGLSIHRAECPNLLATSSTRWVEVTWPAALQQNYNTALLIRAERRKGVLANISSSISVDDAEIVELNACTLQNGAEIDVLLSVRDLDHLGLIMQHLRQMSEVVELRRR